MTKVHSSRRSIPFFTKTMHCNYHVQCRRRNFRMILTIFSWKKNEKIRSEFSNSQRNCFDFDENIIESTLSTFRQLNEEQVRTMIKKCPNKSCSLDSIPTSLLKACLDELVPTITNMINRSLQEGNMPKNLKHSIVSPRIKKPNLPF